MATYSPSPLSPSAFPTSPYSNLFGEMSSFSPQQLPPPPHSPASTSSAVASPSSTAYGRSMATLMSTFKMHTADRTPSSGSMYSDGRNHVFLGSPGLDSRGSPQLPMMLGSPGIEHGYSTSAMTLGGGPDFEPTGADNAPAPAGNGMDGLLGADGQNQSLFSFGGLAKPAVHEDSVPPVTAIPQPPENLKWDSPIDYQAYGMDYGELASPTTIMRRHSATFDTPMPEAQQITRPPPLLPVQHRRSASPGAVSPGAVSPAAVSPAAVSPRPHSMSQRKGSDVSLAGRKRARDEEQDDYPLPPAAANDEDAAPAARHPFLVPQLSFSTTFANAQERKDDWDDDDGEQDASGLLVGTGQRATSASPNLSSHLAAIGSLDGNSRTGSTRSMSPHPGSPAGSVSPSMIEGGLHTSSLGRTNIPFAAGHKKSISSSAIITSTQMTDSHTLPRAGSGGRIESTYSGPEPKIGIRRNSSLSILTSRMALVPPAQRELQAQMQVPAQMMQMDVTQGSQAQQTAHAEGPAGPMAPLAPSLQLILGDFMESLNIAQAEERAVAAEYVQQAQQQVNEAQAQVEAQMAVQRVRSNAMMAAAVAQQQQQQNQQRQDGVQYSADMFVDDQSVSQNNYIGQTAATTQSPMFYAQLPDGSFVPVLDSSRILQQQPIAIQQPQFDAAAMYNSLQQTAAPGEKIIMVPYRTDETGNMYPIQCSIQTMSPGSARGILSSQGMMMQNFASPISTPTLSSMGTAGSLKLSDNIAMPVENDPYATAPGSYSSASYNNTASGYQPPKVIQLADGQFAHLTGTVPQGSSMLLVPSMASPEGQAVQPQAQQLYQQTGNQKELYGVAVPSSMPLTAESFEPSMHPKPQQKHLHGSQAARPVPYAVAAGYAHNTTGGSAALAAAVDRAKSKSPVPPVQHANSLPSFDKTRTEERQGPAKRKKGSLPRGSSNLHNSGAPIILPPDHNPMAAATAIVANRKPVPITGPAPPGATSGPAGTHTPSGKAKMFKCELCPQTFSRSHDLKRHVGIHTGIRPFSCDQCGRTFSRRDALNRHHKMPCADDPDDPDPSHGGRSAGGGGGSTTEGGDWRN